MPLCTRYAMPPPKELIADSLFGGFYGISSLPSKKVA